ncbi:MAG: hypothetical protein FJX36_07185 [Alphaproteobacteria bacterium]|nr:hypothetical protein [Alphaproteobacteria bacterium]
MIALIAGDDATRDDPRDRARNSSFVFRGSDAHYEAIAAQLGVRYLLIGTVQPGDRVVINVRLFDTSKGENAWNGQFEAGFPDIFGVLGAIVRGVAMTMLDEPEEALIERAGRVRASTPEAYEALLKGREFHGRLTPQGDALARIEFARALELNPRCAEAFAWLAVLHTHEYRQERRDDVAERGSKCARSALALDDDIGLAHQVLGYLQLFRKRFLQAQFHMSKGIGLDPNDLVAAARMGLLYCYLGKANEALELFQRSARLNPCHPGRYLGVRGMALFVGRR